MKKVIFAFLITVSFLFSSFTLRGYSATTNIPQNNIQQINYNPDIDYVEYVLVSDQWYEITHYVDGTIGVVPVIGPPNY